MFKILFKKFLVLFMVFAFEFANISVTFAAKPKSKSNRRTAGKGGSKKKKAGKSSRRSAGSKRRSAKSARRYAGNRRRTPLAGDTRNSADGTNGKDPKVNEKILGKCKAAYVTCMDLQINGLISKYSYINSDPAIEAMIETGDPLRCVYYHDKESGNDFDGSVSGNKDINNLFFGYNYYCTPEPTIENGRPVNKCRYSNVGKEQKAVFATPNSFAYYKEANKRMENGDLKIINFTQTKLWTDKIEKVMGDSLKDYNNYKVESNDVSDLMKGLGISNDSKGTETNAEKPIQLFSISVAPPANSGSFSPSGAYNRAHNICIGELDLPTKKESGLSKAVIDKDLKAAIARLKTGSCQKEDFSDFYIEGSEEDNFKSFLSAKKSCEKYENALISMRNSMYAKFQDGFTNYLQDNLAKIIKKNSKDTNTIASSINSVVTEHTKNVSERELAKKKAEINDKKIEREKTRLDREEELAGMQQQIDLEDKGRELDNKRAQTAKRKAEAVKEMLEAKTADLLRLCNAEADKMMEGDSKNIFAEMNKMKVCTWGVALDKVAVGNECVETEKSKTTNTDNSSDNTKKENYIERNCTEIAGFDLNKKIMSNLDENKFELVHENITAGTLGSGIYKVELAGGAGGSGGGTTGTICGNGSSGGKGGNGGVEFRIFVLSNLSKFNAVIGSKGESGGDSTGYNVEGGWGKDGTPSSFEISGVVEKIIAEGGKAGSPGWSWGCQNSSNGTPGINGGNGENSGKGYVKIYRYPM